MNYTFRDFYIREDMLDGIKRYIEYGIPPGSFLSGIISNDLREAVSSADDENLHNIPAFLAYFYNEAPSSCWGSPEQMKNWMKEKREEAQNESA